MENLYKTLTKRFKAVLLSFLLASPAHAEAQAASDATTEYTAQGIVIYDLIHEKSASAPLHREFSIAVKGNSWEISVRLLNSTNRNTFYYAYDGTNLTYLTVRAPGDAKGTSGLIEACPVPHMWLSTCGEFIWMALGSGNHFKSLTNSTSYSIHALKSKSGIIHRDVVPVDFELSPVAPNLPIKLSYRTEDIRYIDESGALHTISIPAPFTKGYVNGVCTTKDFKQYGKLQIPVGFTYKGFSPVKDVKNVNDLRCILNVTGTITNVLPNALFTLVMPDNVTFQDARLQAPIVPYRITDKKIPTTNSLIVQNAIERGIAVQSNDKNRQPLLQTRKVNLTFKILFLILFSTPLIFFLFLKKPKPKL